MSEPLSPLQMLLPGLIALSAAAWIVRVAMRTNRTSFRGCALLALAGLTLASATAGANGFIDGLFAGAAACILCFIARAFRPALMGRDTIVLAPTMFALAGTSPAMLTALIISWWGNCSAMLVLRNLPIGARLFRSGLTAGLREMATLVPLLLWRHFSAFLPDAPGAQAPRFGNALVDITGRGWLDLLSWGFA